MGFNSGFKGLNFTAKKISSCTKLLSNTRAGGAEGWSKRHSKELHNLYSSPDIIRVIKIRRMRQAKKPGR